MKVTATDIFPRLCSKNMFFAANLIYIGTCSLMTSCIYLAIIDMKAHH